ncbi:MAG: PIN domain-containing protein [Nitrospirae bacterium]|nr:PIN domain-containing protein [Nitrospirota bacterium]
MAKIKLLVDTDIIIDYLKGIKPAREFFKSDNFDIYCSVLSQKELLSKKGLSDSERKRIKELLLRLKDLKIDNEISKKYMLLLNNYGEIQSSIADYVIAATAWAKNLPLLTRNRKHFEQIKEIQLSPVYEDTAAL